MPEASYNCEQSNKILKKLMDNDIISNQLLLLANRFLIEKIKILWQTILVKHLGLGLKKTVFCYRVNSLYWNFFLK